MTIRGLLGWFTLCCVLLMSACGGGSGRGGTDVVVSGTGPTSQVLGGQTAVFVMTVRNAGPNTANDVVISDLVGNQLALTGITCSASGGAVCPATSSVQMTVPTLGVGASLSFTVTVQLFDSAKGTISNTMTAEAGEDTDSSNNKATVSAAAYTPSASVVVGGSSIAGTLTGGATAEFPMFVRNDGPDAATNLRIVDNAGSGLQFNGLTCTASGGATCPTPGLAMTLDSLPVGGRLDFAVSTTVGASVNGTVANTLTVSSDADPNRSDNAFVATANVVTARNGVFVTGVGPSATLVGGGSAAFTMQVSNSGPDAATNVSIVNQVGSNLSFTGVSCTAAAGANCPASLGPVMSVPSLPAGGTLTFVVNTTVAPGTNGAVIDTMSVAAANDSDRTDNSATAVGTVSTPRASLVVTGTPPAGQVPGGGTAVFVMTVGNTGPDAATDVRVGNTVGSNLTFTGATCAASGGASCPATVGVIANVGTLPVGGLLTFKVSATVAAGTNGAITNTVQATASDDANPSGNTAVAVGQAFTARSNVVVTGVGPTNVPGGSTANFQMTVSNPSGPQAADTIHLVNAVGSNLTQTGVTCTASGGAACPASTGAVMDVGSLPVGGSLVFNVAATVAAGVQGTITNTLDATVTTGGVKQSVSGVAVGSAYSDNIGVSGTAPAGPLVGGASAYFTMTVGNAGPGAAQNVSISNTLGAGLSAGVAPISCVATGGAACPSVPAPTMSIPSMPANSALTFTVPVIVDAGTNGTVTDTMTATAAGDVRANDNSAAVSVTANSVDLGVSESGASQIAIGSPAVFTAIVGNPGSATVNNLTVSHTLGGVAGTSATITCAASSSATCPDTSAGSTFAVPALPARSSLTFTITTPNAPSAGNIVSTTTVAAAGDPNPGNNAASATTAAADARNGSYTVFAADGKAYGMSIDFDAGHYTMTGGAQTAFTAGSGSEYEVAGVPAFRVGTDIVVGRHDFGAGAVPYVAARNLGSALSDLNGQYDFVTRDTLVANSSVVTRPGVAVVASDDSALFVCQAATGAPKSVSQCPGGAASYSLAVSGNVYTATPITGGTSLHFYLVRSGASKMLLGAYDSTDALNQSIRRFMLGLQDLVALAGGTLTGPGSNGDWITQTLSATSYAAVGVTTPAQSAVLSLIPNSGATSMLQGTLASDASAGIYVMQAGPMAATFGESSGTANGLLQLALP